MPDRSVDDNGPFGLAARRDPQEPRRSLAARLSGGLTALFALFTILLAATIAFLAVGPLVLPYKVDAVLSGSMEPTIPVGSLVLLRPVDAGQVAVGDIITFHRPDRSDQLVTHRVVGIEDVATGRAFVTQGDANPAPDPWRVPATGSGWRCVFNVPYLGYPISAAASPLGRMALIMAPIFALGLTILIPLWLPRRRLPVAGARR